MKNVNNLKKEGRGDTGVWRKILLFSVLFPPYALYLFLLKTKVKLWIKTVIVVLVSVVVFLILDIGINPNRVHNEVMYNEIIEEKSKGNINIGDVYFLNKRKDVLYEDKKYLTSYMYDENDMYFGIFEIIDYNKNYDLKYLYKLDSHEKLVYGGDFLKEFSGVHPFVIEEILTNEAFDSIKKEIRGVNKVVEKNLFYNDKTQVVEFSNSRVVFKFNDFGVFEYSSSDKSILSEDIVNGLYYSEFGSVYDVLYRNFKDKYEIVGYNYYRGIHSFNIIVGDTKYVVEYIYGKGASLQSIDDEKIYMSYLKAFYE